jgi:DNA-binding HxlR family transcriptional regulator
MKDDFLTKQQQYEAFVSEKEISSPTYCLLTVVSNLIGGKWKMQVLTHLLSGPVRFGEMKRYMPQITEKMLIQALRELETDGLISRKQYEEVPPKVEYSLTQIGEELRPLLIGLVNWGKQYVSTKKEACSFWDIPSLN